MSDKIVFLTSLPQALDSEFLKSQFSEVVSKLDRKSLGTSAGDELGSPPFKLVEQGESECSV